MIMTIFFFYFKAMFHVLQDISVIWAAALDEIKPRGTRFKTKLLKTMNLWHYFRKEREISKQKKVLKFGSPCNHFSAITSGQKTVRCDFFHLNIHSYNISREFVWFLDLLTDFCHINYRSLNYGSEQPFSYKKLSVRA